MAQEFVLIPLKQLLELFVEFHCPKSGCNAIAVLPFDYSGTEPRCPRCGCDTTDWKKKMGDLKNLRDGIVAIAELQGYLRIPKMVLKETAPEPIAQQDVPTKQEKKKTT